MQPSLVLALLALGAAAQPSNVSVLVGRGDTLLGWTTTFNIPSPGNGYALSVGATVPWSVLPFLNISYNFVDGTTNTEMLTPRTSLALRCESSRPGVSTTRQSLPAKA